MIESITFLLILVLLFAIGKASVAWFVGITSVALWYASNPEDKRRLKVLVGAFAMLGSLCVITSVLNLVNELCPYKYDLYLHAIDHALGFCPAQLVGRVASSLKIIPVVLGFYQLLPSMMVAGYGWAVYNDEESAKRLLWAYVISGSCVFLYFIVPASGPTFLLSGDVLSSHTSPEIGLTLLNRVANCIPSLHLSTALLIWFFNRSNKTAANTSLIFVFLTAFATLALGEHYSIDLVMSFPFTLFLTGAVTGHYRRASCAVVAVVAWLIAIRLGIGVLVHHPVLLWTAAVATILVSFAYLPFSAPILGKSQQRVPSKSVPTVALTPQEPACT